MRRKEWLANLGEMSAGMAHEIRNPLGALAGAMQMLRKESTADATDRRLMDIAIREATRLDAIITEFLQYARPPELDLAEHNINKILAETMDLVQHEARIRKRITIATSLAVGPWWPRWTRIKCAKCFGTSPRTRLTPCRMAGNRHFDRVPPCRRRRTKRHRRNRFPRHGRGHCAGQFRQDLSPVFYDEERRFGIGAGRRSSHCRSARWLD